MDSSDSEEHGTNVGEKLCTIAEESLEASRCLDADDRERSTVDKGTPKKSATFHNGRELKRANVHSLYRTSANGSSSDYQIKFPTSHLATPKAKSLLFEMGERIRLFSTGSFVTSSGEENGNCIPKAQSLNSFDTKQLVFPARSHCSKKGGKGRICPQGKGSVVSLNHHIHFSADLPSPLSRAPSQLGMLCQQCSTQDIPCAKAVAQDLRSSSAASSLYSISHASFSSPNDPLCRICHCTWPADPLDPLISPCRCSGSLQYVHVSCLMHWLDISSRKLHRPAVCELCLYKYRRRRVLKYREIKFPDCNSKDLRYYTLFLSAILLMILSAVATVLCFQMEKKYAPNGDNIQLSSSTVPSTHPRSPSPSSSSTLSNDTPPLPPDEMENLLSTITLVAAILFFFSFFMAMYAHVKSGLSLCNYISLCWTSNLEWSIEEYRISRDTQYLNKLEELRRKINEKQKKAPEEIEPLRSSVIVID